MVSFTTAPINKLIFSVGQRTTYPLIQKDLIQSLENDCVLCKECGLTGNTSNKICVLSNKSVQFADFQEFIFPKNHSTPFHLLDDSVLVPYFFGLKERVLYYEKSGKIFITISEGEYSGSEFNHSCVELTVFPNTNPVTVPVKPDILRELNYFDKFFSYVGAETENSFETVISSTDTSFNLINSNEKDLANLVAFLKSSILKIFTVILNGKENADPLNYFLYISSGKEFFIKITPITKLRNALELYGNLSIKQTFSDNDFLLLKNKSQKSNTKEQAKIPERKQSESYSQLSVKEVSKEEKMSNLLTKLNNF